MKIYRNAKPVDESLENDVDPKDKATIKDLKAALKKAADEGTEAEFKAAQKAYDDFMDKIASKTNDKVRVFRNLK